MLRDLQDAFRRSVLEAADDDMRPCLMPGGIAVDKRLGIHRANTFASLVSVLEAAYPVIHRVVGQDNFRIAGSAYVKAHPPAAPRLSGYGDRFGAFLADFKPARAIAFLSDLARLEWARNEAFFAADAEPLTTADLQALPQERYPALRLTLHPAAALIASRFPVHGIWTRYQADGRAGETIESPPIGHHVLVTRPHSVVESAELTREEFTFLLAFQAGANLAEAANAALQSDPRFDLQGVLLTHLTRGTFSAFDDKKENSP